MTADLCPGGTHPLPIEQGTRRSPSRRLCCDPCWDRLPRDLPDFPKFRSRVRSNFALRENHPGYYRGRDENRTIFEAVRTWLTDNPRETSNP